MAPARASTKPSAPPTRAEWVDAQLRRAILGGDLRPGEKLQAERLADEWGVSPTPLRETFQRLAGEGLVVIEPQRGARVAPLSADDAAEIYELRLLLDPVALQRSMLAAEGDAGFVELVESTHRSLAGRHRSLADYHDAHRAFHLALVSRCPNARMLQQVTQLLDHSRRFQAVGACTAQRPDPAVEHAQLAEAVCAGDRRAAATLLGAHLRATLAAVRATAEADGGTSATP